MVFFVVRIGGFNFVLNVIRSYYRVLCGEGRDLIYVFERLLVVVWRVVDGGLSGSRDFN